MALVFNDSRKENGVLKSLPIQTYYALYFIHAEEISDITYSYSPILR